ncbi:MAG TPA: mitochondrial fission ELM1 family protein [Rhodanobacteraceae bacterium]|jgi:mitochondrial fission protein ELM1|nr:mitochondrial fission ELM1 family protein [Rhodanobacteraceae bacterium]
MREAWVITDGAAGNERQALALAQALDAPARVLRLPLRAPWAWLAPRKLPGGRLALSARDRVQFAPPWPALAIGCGRHASLLTRLLRELSHGNTFSVQILDPRMDPRHWDAVIAPRHDDLHGDNVIETTGSLNPIDDDWLTQGREAFTDFARLPQPRIALLLGGPRRGVAFDEAYARALADGVAARAKGGSVLASVSRRTPQAVARMLREKLAHLPGVFWSGEGDGPNPYPGLLGWADAIVVTPDSVNMLSEAAAVGVPVHAPAAAPLPDKLARFHAALRQRGSLQDLDAQAARVATPLRETARVAAQLKEWMASRTA